MANGTGNPNCTICEAGWYATGHGNGWCDICIPGTFAHDKGQATCQKCNSFYDSKLIRFLFVERSSLEQCACGECQLF